MKNMMQNAVHECADKANSGERYLENDKATTKITNTNRFALRTGMKNMIQLCTNARKIQSANRLAVNALPLALANARGTFSSC
jgi:hypothetical protein